LGIFRYLRLIGWTETTRASYPAIQINRLTPALSVAVTTLPHFCQCIWGPL